jgi:hypothetical protein
LDRRADACAGLIERRASRFRFELAGAEDEAELRRLARETPLPGPVEITLRREPNFFAASAVEGPFHQVLVVRDSWHGGRIVAMGSRSVRERYIHGGAQPVGYLGGLRIAPEVRGGALLVRGFQELRRLHSDGRASFYLTTISDGNSRAVEMLTSGRGGLPRYYYLGQYFTFVLPTRAARGARSTADIRPLEDAARDEWLRFLDETGRRKLFFPRYTAADIAAESATFRGLRPNQVMVCRQEGRIVGTLAVWDQTSFRQTIVERYRGPIRWWRPWHNLAAPWLGRPRLPAPGSCLRQRILALPLVRDDQAGILEQLVAAAQRELAGNADCLLLGLFERDPLLPVVRHQAVHTYVSRVYVVAWDDDGVDPRNFGGRNLYLELGCL